MEPARFAGRSFDLNLGNLTVSPSYLQAGAIVFLLFILVLTLARLRKMYVTWSLRTFLPSIFIGFLFMLILEGFLIIGGRTLLTEILGWDNAPKPIRNVLDIGRAKLVKVLGVSEEIPASSAMEKPGLYDVVTQFQSLPPDEAETFRSMICEP
jgi:hypothetical protein